MSLLIDVGVEYLTLSRSAASLSGGESQRIRLATQIGSSLSGVLYVLEEPSIGLHQKDNDRLIATMKKLRDLDNTVVVVEHDLDTMLADDFFKIDMGHGAVVFGGEVVAIGTPTEVSLNPSSITGQYLSVKQIIEVPKFRRKPKSFLQLKGVTNNNLQNIDVDIPLLILIAVTVDS